MRNSSTNLLNSLKITLSVIILLYIFKSIDPNRQQKINVHKLERDATVIYQYRPAKLAVNPILKFKMKQEQNRLFGRRNLNDMSTIISQNSETLPNAEFPNNSSICVGDDAVNCVPKFQSIDTTLMAVPAKELLACIIPQNLPIMLEAILCYLLDSKTFITAQRNIHSEHPHIAFCQSTKYKFKSWTQMDAFARQTLESIDFFSKFKSFAIIREPIDRFLAGFLENCVRRRYGDRYCNGCRQNLTCFVESEYRRILSTNIDKIEDDDFLPQSWRCNFQQLFGIFQQIRYVRNDTDGLVAQLMDIFYTQNITKIEAKFIRSELENFPLTPHMPSDQKAYSFYEQRLRTNPFLMERVLRMFYWDFQIFGYPLPLIQ